MSVSRATKALQPLRLALSLLALLWLTLAASAARANRITVMDNSDGSSVSLRAAVAAAQPGDTIVFAPGVTHIVLTSGEIEITAPMTIYGPGVTVDGNNSSRVFEVSSGTGTAQNPVALTGLTIQNGSTNSDSGGGLLNGGTATLTGCTLANNSASYGGGLMNDGTATLTGCTLANNSASYGGNGGGIYNKGKATLTACSLTGNLADGGLGGGVYNEGPATLTGCTLRHNSTVNGYGGGIYDNNFGKATLTDDILYDQVGFDTGGDVNSFTISYCDLGQGLSPGTGNISTDPQFVGDTDQHLKYISPCIGAGVAVAGNEYDITGATRADPPTMGAYESDTIAPVVTATADRTSLWPPNNKMVTVTISGQATDTGSGVNPASGSYSVTDSQGTLIPGGTFTVGSGGTYSFPISLQASRSGKGTSGRTYTVSVTVADKAGNVSKPVLVIITVPHDQGK